jgi:ketosteroid isomerase-like protein
LTSQPKLAEMCAAVMAAHQQLMTRFQQGNAAGVAAIYAEAGQLLPVYSAAICGRAAIQAFWQGWIDMGIGVIRRTPLEVDCLHDTVNEVGTYRFFDCHGRVLDVGKYVVIWKEEHDQWKIQRDIWTSNLPGGE